jgi:hypothetical protein
MFLWVNNSNTSCLFFLTLLITGIRNTSDMNREHDAAIKRYRNTPIFDYLLVSDSVMMASVELFRASKTLFRQFFITKSTEA